MAPPAEQISLDYLSAFASFLYDHHLEAFSDYYLHLMGRSGLSAFRNDARSLEAIRPLFFEVNERSLRQLAEGRFTEQLEQMVERVMPVGKESLEDLKRKSKDVFQFNLLRKQALSHFIPHYSSEVSVVMGILEDVDRYSLLFEQVANDAYLQHLESRLKLREEQLLESEALYKEAQAMARIGNWSWNFRSGDLQWSDELYRIYHQAPQSVTLSIKLIIALTHPEDRKALKESVLNLLRTGEPFLHICRIVPEEGIEKIVEIKGRLMRDAQGKPERMIGTTQDVTNEQGLIRRLQESERQHQQMEQLSRTGSWVRDLHTGRIQWSREMYHIFGMDPAGGPIPWQKIAGYLDEEDVPRMHDAIRNCQELGTSYKIQYRLTLPDGSKKLLLAKGEAALDEHGQPFRLFGTIQDVTGHHLLLEQLQRSEVLYKQAQAIARIGNWIYDIKKGKTAWSEELYRIYELKPGTVAQSLELILERALPLDRALLEAHIKRCIENLQPYDCHYRIVMADGSVKSLRAKGEAIAGENGKATGLLGTIQDITEQMLVERRLREHQRFIQKITDITPSIIAVYNIQNGSYLFINQAIQKLLGYSPDQVMAEGLPFLLSILHPDDMESLMEQNTAAIDQANSSGSGTGHDEKVNEFKYRLRHRDGTYRWFQTYGTIFERDEEGKVLQVLNISIDITGQEQAEHALNQKNLQLQQSNASLEEFAYIASHDLQEPLRKISTFGNMLETLQEGDLSPSGKIYLKKIVDSSIRMQSMINDLLSVSVISGNKSFAPEALQPLLDEALMALEHKIEQTGATIDVPAPLPSAPVIAAQFRQLFQNLIGNSLKFARAGVPPVIHISFDFLSAEDCLTYGLDGAQRYLRLRLADNGIGFSNHYANKIFAIFQRLHGKSEYEGTGIGLAICRKIAEHHKGFIFASGEPDNGAVFTVIIPA